MSFVNLVGISIFNIISTWRVITITICLLLLKGYILLFNDTYNLPYLFKVYTIYNKIRIILDNIGKNLTLFNILGRYKLDTPANSWFFAFLVYL